MSVFICWSLDRSHDIAKAVATLLGRTLPQLADEKAIFVSDDIEKGVAWFDSIVRELQRSTVGIVCLTAENLESPWMHFEAGALARELSELSAPAEEQGTATGADSSLRQIDVAVAARPAAPGRRLFTLLHGVTGAELKGPLSAYQATSTSLPEMRELVSGVAHAVHYPEILKPRGGKDVIHEDDWKKFESAVKDVTIPARTLIRDLQLLFQRKTFNEPLHHCADQAWLRRYEGARSTHERLGAHLDRVKAACSAHEQGLFEMLLAELNGYSMAIQSLLLTPREFKLGDLGELQMDQGILTCCEDRRLAIRSIAARLLHPLDDPLTADAVRFMAAETNEERKMIVHRLEGRIRRKREEAYEAMAKGLDRHRTANGAITQLTEDFALKRTPKAKRVATTKKAAPPKTEPLKLLSLRESSWDLDRIYYYLLIQYFDIAALRWEPVQRSEAGSKADQTPDSPAVRRDAQADSRTTPMEHDWFCAARDVEMEVERYRAKSKGGSLMPLTYALVALNALQPGNARQHPKVQSAVKSAATLVNDELGDVLKTEQGRPIVRLLNELQGLGAGDLGLGTRG
jgi:hypothetical protein